MSLTCKGGELAVVVGVGAYRCEDDSSGQVYARFCMNAGPKVFSGGTSRLGVYPAATHEVDAEAVFALGAVGRGSLRSKWVTDNSFGFGLGAAVSYCYTTPLTAGLKKP